MDQLCIYINILLASVIKIVHSYNIIWIISDTVIMILVLDKIYKWSNKLKLYLCKQDDNITNRVQLYTNEQ